MASYDYIPFEEDNDEPNSPGGKRKFETPTPDPETRESKRLRMGACPVGISHCNSSSSPVSTVPSETVPTQHDFHVLQAQREAYEDSFGSDYHAYALKELKNAVERFENINLDRLLDEEALKYLRSKLKENILARHRQANSSSSKAPSSDDYPGGTCSETASSESSSNTSPKRASPERSPFLAAFDRCNSSSPVADPVDMGDCYFTQSPAKMTVSTASNRYMGTPSAFCSESSHRSVGTNTDTSPSYIEVGTNPTTPCSYTNVGADPVRPSPYTDAGTNPITSPPYTNVGTDPVIPSSYADAGADPITSCAYTDVGTDTVTSFSFYTEASTQSSPVPVTSPSIELWKRQLELIRRPQPVVPYDYPTTVVKCLLREPEKTAAAIQSSSHAPRTSSSSSFSNKQKVVAVVDLLSSDDEDEDDNNNNNSNNANKFPGCVRVGGSGRQNYNLVARLNETEKQYMDLENDLHHGGTAYYGGSSPSPSTEEDPDELGMRVRMEDFYGLARGDAGTEQSRRQLRYQVNTDLYQRNPSPAAGLQLRLDDYLRDVGSTHRRDVGFQIGETLRRTSWGVEGGLDAASTERAWRRSRGARVLRGFPLVEGVRFLAPGNHGEPEGDCYWRALSFHLYGGDGHWDLVKAEHLAYVHHVLTHEAHPRHALYARHLNARFFDTAAPSPGEGDGDSGCSYSFKANIWQVLHMAHAWTPALMQQVSADLYNICVVTFGARSWASLPSSSPDSSSVITVTETTMRGAYNSRHVFLLYADDSHFQPMMPTDYYDWEFQYPRPTAADTAQYRFAPKATSSRGALEHAWRREFTASVLPPVPRLHGCHVDKLRRYMGSRPGI
ncbi:hypothetical protein DL764_004408 [Monosporascus ibericus]|uniref:OTU domain-containing protein n=1 Tax=Monosporascus ibericus TaxID=155417 RepID=A0A4Q4TGB3_9PEZI|nr:hypothetical protein DL764_004408 [Monosporascus ibericus]